MCDGGDCGDGGGVGGGDGGGDIDLSGVGEVIGDIGNGIGKAIAAPFDSDFWFIINDSNSGYGGPSDEGPRRKLTNKAKVFITVAVAAVLGLGGYWLFSEAKKKAATVTHEDFIAAANKNTLPATLSIKGKPYTLYLSETAATRDGCKELVAQPLRLDKNMEATPNGPAVVAATICGR